MMTVPPQRKDLTQNTAPCLGVCYYPEHWSADRWRQDAARMNDLGLTYVRVGEFSWSVLEPGPEQLSFDWLDEAVDVLGNAGLKVVLGTPTATPPKWIVDTMPEMIALGSDGSPRRFGSRRHYCFSHTGYRKHCVRIVSEMAQHYAANPHVVAWQTDNEYGCHDTTLSYSDAARDAFRHWLQEQYASIDALNNAWGNVFWSMNYRSFDEIELPNLTVTEANPAHCMAFRRFSSDQVVTFNRLQTTILRKYCAHHDLIHNFMGHYFAFDHYDVAQDLDIASWDSYPLGFLDVLNYSDQHKLTYARAGDPDFQAFHHDLYRGVGRGRWWVMEQQPGPVNWARYNVAPYDGQVRLWTLEALAHGAEVVSYFRWRQVPFAQEQLHTGLRNTNDEPAVVYDEIAQVAQELSLFNTPVQSHSPVAMVFDYASFFALTIQPHGANFSYYELAFSWYRALRKLGLSIDIVSTDHDLSNYSLVIVPCVITLSEKLIASLQVTEAVIVVGPRTGSRTRDFLIPANLAPGLLQSLIPLTVSRVESLRPGLAVEVTGGGALTGWREYVTTSAKVSYQSDDGWPVVVEHDNLSYVAGRPDDSLLHSIFSQLCARAGLATLPIGEQCPHLRVRDIGTTRFFFNYGDKPCSIAPLLTTAQSSSFVLGGADMPLAGVSAISLPTAPRVPAGHETKHETST